MVLILEEKGLGIPSTRNFNPSSPLMLSGSNLVSGSLYRRHSLSWEWGGWKGQKASQRMKGKESEGQAVMKMQVHHKFKLWKTNFLLSTAF